MQAGLRVWLVPLSQRQSKTDARASLESITWRAACGALSNPVTLGQPREKGRPRIERDVRAELWVVRS